MELVQVMTWNIDSGPAMNDRAQKDVNRDVSTIAQPSSDVNIATTDLLDKYADVFEGLGKFNGQLHLQLDEAVPPVQLPARRLPIAVRDNVKAEIGRLVQEGVLAPVNEPTEWVSAMVVVKKANGSVRLCIDPKPLNKALKRNHYHLRTIDDVLPELAGKKYFSVVDVKSGFWHVELDESSSYLTTMATPFGKYRWTRMPFGISPSPEEFARRLHDEIQGLPGVVSIADDILVFGDNGEDHDRHLEGLLQRCRDRNIILNRDKAVIRKDRVNYMGFVLTSEGCQPDPDKIAVIKDMPAPTEKKGVQRLLGMVNFVSRFAPHLSQVCAPLRDLIKDEIHFQWDPHIHGRCFNTIKDILSTAPVLKYFDSTKPTTLQCDSSERGLGACLMQGDHPIAYSSRALTPTEQHYAQIEKELLSVCFGVEKFQQFVYGRKTTIETDHKPLEIIWRKSMTSAPKRLQRMLLRLQHFDLDIVYKKGEHMYMADTLSRAYLPLPTSSAPDMTDHVLAMSDVDTAEEANIISFVAVSDARKAAIREATCADSEMIALKKTIKQGWPETPGALPEMVRPYFNFRDELAVADEFILKGDRLVIPASHRQSIMDKLHYGHTGIQACTRRAREVVFWRGMVNDIAEYVKKCEVCSKYLGEQQKEPLIPHEIPSKPWNKLGTDLFHCEGKLYLITVDYYSDFFEIDRIETAKTTEVVRKLKAHFARYGIPQTIISDNGPPYCSEQFAVFVKTYDIEHLTSSPRYPQSNGKVENAVKQAKRLMLKTTALIPTWPSNQP